MKTGNTGTLAARTRDTVGALVCGRSLARSPNRGHGDGGREREPLTSPDGGNGSGL